MSDPPWRWLSDDLRDRLHKGYFRHRRRIDSAQGVHIRYRGREFINFSSNDYLNLAADPRLKRASARAAQRYGAGTGASPLISGYLPPLRHLERDLAHWEGTEAALVFSSGFATNLAAVSTLASREDVIFSDDLNHASLIDGCRLSRARVHIFRHADVGHLEDLLRKEGSASRRRLIVTDSLFSMDGDLAPLEQYLALAERYDCLLLLDEAHATGVLGEQGRGATELLPPVLRHHERIIKVGTLSKALGSQGGFICGPKLLIAWLINHCRPYIFSTALAPPAAAAARQALAIVRAEPERRQQALALADLLRAELKQLGYLEGLGRCQIVPLLIGNARAASELSARLEEQGLLAPAIRPPSVPEGTSRLRLSLTAGHTTNDVRRLVDALRAMI